MTSCNIGNAIPAQCSATSLGPASQAFLALLQTFVAAECMISPSSMWPDDQGAKFTSEEGNCSHFIPHIFDFSIFFYLIVKKS